MTTPADTHADGQPHVQAQDGASAPDHESPPDGEYDALRQEVLKRVELEHNIILFGNTALAALWAVTATAGDISIVLLYPFISLALVLGWAFNHARVDQIAAYIRDIHEHRAAGWETYLASTRGKSPWIDLLEFVYAVGFFVGSGVLAVVPAFTQSNISEHDRVLSDVDFVLIFAAFVIMIVTRLQYLKTTAKSLTSRISSSL